jgi:RND family efflux transporter MFP subunit
MAKFTLTLLIAQLTLLLVGCQTVQDAGNPETAPPVPIVAKPVRAETMQRPIPCQGIVYPRRQIALSFSRGGRLANLNVREGFPVKPGDTLATLDRAALAAAVQETQKKLTAAKADLERQRKLRAKAKIDPAAWDSLQNYVSLMQGFNLSSKEALKRSAVLAPYAGRIVRLFAALGDSVYPGKIILLLAEMEPQAIARVELSQSDYYRAQINDLAIVSPRALADLPLTGMVLDKEMSDDLDNFPYSAEIVFENPGAVASYGSAVSAKLTPAQWVSVLLIPKEALLLRKGSSAAVFVANEKNKFALKRHLQLGPEIGSEVIVDGGLQVGELVVTANQALLREGARVIISTPQMRRFTPPDKPQEETTDEGDSDK